MSDQPFVWYELSTPDPAAAKGFYERLAGWTMQDSPMPGMTYTLAFAGDQQVAGIMALPEQAKANGAPPHWAGYVGVDDVDASAEKAKGLGGRVYAGPMDIPGVGRFAALADPQGAVFCIFKGTRDEGPPRDPMKPGHFGWHELMTSDLDGALAFYGALFGWTKGDGYDMGEMGTYQILQNDETAFGGAMRRPPSVPASYWGYYINVGDIDRAAEQVRAGGGEVLMGPASVPGGAWIVQGRDPQGAYFACMGSRG